MEVLSFVRSVLASPNKKLATFSAEFSAPVECFSLACAAAIQSSLASDGREGETIGLKRKMVYLNGQLNCLLHTNHIPEAIAAKYLHNHIKIPTLK